jgi:hypothetical protein
MKAGDVGYITLIIPNNITACSFGRALGCLKDNVAFED